MKYVRFIMLGVVLMLLTACGVQQGNQEVSTISVVGFAKGEVTPDVAYVTLDVFAEDEEIEEAKKVVDNVTSDLFKLLKTVGIEEDSIETTNYQVSEIRDFNISASDGMGSNLPNPIAGQKVSSNLKITVDNLEELETIIDIVSGSENINVNNLNYDVLDKEEAKKEILEEAINDAKEKSNIIAKSLKVDVEGVHKVDIRDSNMDVRVMTAEFNKSMDTGIGSTISPQNINLDVLVEIDFIIK